MNNAIFKHVHKNNHSVLLRDERFEIVSKINNTNKRKLIESILIQNSDNFNMNQCNFKLDAFTNNYVKHNLPYMKNLLNKVNVNLNSVVDRLSYCISNRFTLIFITHYQPSPSVHPPSSRGEGPVSLVRQPSRRDNSNRKPLLCWQAAVYFATPN